MTSSWTVRQAAERTVGLGLVDAATAARRLDRDELDRTLDYFGAPDGHAVLRLLAELGIVYVVDWEQFRGVCESGLETYESELARIAAASSGLLAITDVELVDGEDGGHVLRFRCNDAQEEWRIPHSDDEDTEDFEAQLTFGTYTDGLTHDGSPHRWCSVTSEADGEPLHLVFADPSALHELASEHGLTFDAC